MFRQGLGNANSPAEDNTPAVPGDNDPAPNDDTTEPDNIVKRALIENGGKGPVQRHSIARAKLLAENARAPETTADTVPRAGELTLFGDTIWFRREEREAMVPQLNDNDFIMVQWAAVAYLICHRITNSDARQVYSHVAPGTIELRKKISQLQKRGTTWQCAILTTYALPIARELYHRYMTKGIDLTTCGVDERYKILEKEQWKDHRGGPYRATIQFWHPLVKYIDFEGIFHPPEGCSEELKSNMRKIRLFFYNTQLTAFNDILQIRIRSEMHPDHFPGKTPSQCDRMLFADWKAMYKRKGVNKESIPSAKEIPIITQ